MTYLNHRKVNDVNVFLSIVFSCHTLAVLETGVGGVRAAQESKVAKERTGELNNLKKKW